MQYNAKVSATVSVFIAEAKRDNRNRSVKAEKRLSHKAERAAAKKVLAAAADEAAECSAYGLVGAYDDIFQPMSFWDVTEYAYRF